MKKILVLEPYYGGSHKHFLDGLEKELHAELEFTYLTLPARKWKMRMQLSAPWFLSKLRELPVEKRKFDTVLCSTFVDVSTLRSLFSMVEGWCDTTKFLTYFHENQFVYPRQIMDKSNYQFTAINFNTALASDSIGFNSHFNLESFLASSAKYVKTAADMKLGWTIDFLREKSVVLYPGIDFTDIDDSQTVPRNEVPVIVWNHRWEHDKNPEEFFDALTVLDNEGIDFQLILLGQKFNRCPECFITAEKQFKEKIIHSGFAESYEQYSSILKRGDIVVSTSLHEFYGISIIEALRAGCLPVLPKRLSYPELFSGKFLYEENKLVETLRSLILDRTALSLKEAKKITEQFSWRSMKDDYRCWLIPDQN